MPPKQENLNKGEEDFIYYIPKFPLEVKLKLEKVKLDKILINGSGSFSTGRKKKSDLKINLTLGGAPANIYAELINSRKNLFLNIFSAHIPFLA